MMSYFCQLLLLDLCANSNNDSQYSAVFPVTSAQNGTGPHPSPNLGCAIFAQPRLG